MSSASTPQEVQAVSVVIPVYRGETTLKDFVEELLTFADVQHTGGVAWRVAEIIAVWDGAKDDSARVMQELARRHILFKPVWLSRNFGQHPATLAGMAASSYAWVATMDEDGMHDPADIGGMLATAIETDTALVYADPLNKPSHGWLRNSASSMVKWILTHLLDNPTIGRFSSFRLVSGEIARSLAAYCGHSVFLDVALSWVIDEAEHCPVHLRAEERRKSAYSFRRLLDHFWRLLLTAGTRPLRAITLLGMLAIVVAVALSVYAVWVKFLHRVPVEGWTSTVVVIAFFSGCILFSLGFISEYLSVALGIVMGKPLYLTTSRPRRRKRS